MRRVMVLLAFIIAVQSSASLHGASPAQELGKWWKNSRIVMALELSGRQIERIEKSYLDHRKKLADLMKSLKEEEARMQSLMEMDAMDDSTILEQSVRVAEARKKLEIARTAMMLAFRKDMSKEQWKRLEAMQEFSALSIDPVPAGSDALNKDAGKMVLPDGTEYYAVGKGVKSPVVIEMPKPPYTAEAREAKAEGIVILEAIVHKDGSVDNFKVLRSLGYGLDESAIRTIASKWLFKPGMRNGESVNTQVMIEVSFGLY